MDNEIELLYPGQEQLLQELKNNIAYSQGLLGLANMKVSHLEMDEFPIADEWSKLMREAIVSLGLSGAFTDRTLLGLGIGDGRNERLAILASDNGFGERSIKKVIGVDTDKAKLGLAYYNLLPQFSYDGINPENKLQLYAGDVVGYLKEQQQRGASWDRPFAFICLPQAKKKNGEGTTSDIIASTYDEYDGIWDRYGLSLNAGTLAELNKIPHSQLDALLVLSGRISPNVRHRLIEETGWFNNRVVKSAIVQHDQDTPLSWMQDLANEDDGQRFFADREGRQPLSILNALDRYHSHQPIFHEVFVYNISA